MGARLRLTAVASDGTVQIQSDYNDGFLPAQTLVASTDIRFYHSTPNGTFPTRGALPGVKANTKPDNGDPNSIVPSGYTISSGTTFTTFKCEALAMITAGVAAPPA